jgi:copper chaperone CopZ
MKNFSLLLLMLISFNTFAGQVRIKVSGMVCSMCAQGIQKKFSSQTSVKEISVNMDEKLVTLQIVEGEEISDDIIKKLITEAGYNVSAIERK